MSFWKDGPFGKMVHLPLKNSVNNSLKTSGNITCKGSHVLFTDCSELECYEAIMEQEKADIKATHDK